MNTLFFEEELTDFELSAFLNQLVDEAMNKSVDSAATILQHNLVQKLVRIQSYLQMLMDIEEESKNYKIAEQIADIAGKMTLLFGLWEYGGVVPHFVLAIKRKETYSGDHKRGGNQ